MPSGKLRRHSPCSCIAHTKDAAFRGGIFVERSTLRNKATRHQKDASAQNQKPLVKQEIDKSQMDDAVSVPRHRIERDGRTSDSCPSPLRASRTPLSCLFARKHVGNLHIRLSSGPEIMKSISMASILPTNTLNPRATSSLKPGFPTHGLYPPQRGFFFAGTTRGRTRKASLRTQAPSFPDIVSRSFAHYAGALYRTQVIVDGRS